MLYIVLRPVKNSDMKQLMDLHKQSNFQNLSRNFIETFLREITIQMIVVLAAILFILVGLPLHLCLVSIPLVATGILALVLAGDLHQSWLQQEDLKDRVEEYLNSAKTGCWVAEARARPAQTGEGVKVLTESQLDQLEAQGYLQEGTARLVGSVAVRLKEDKNMTEPPGTVGLMERLMVVPSLRRMGVGQELVLVAWNHCVKHLRAVELSIQANNPVARRFFESQDWLLMSVKERQLIGFIKVEEMIYRKACKRSLDDTL